MAELLETNFKLKFTKIYKDVDHSVGIYVVKIDGTKTNGRVSITKPASLFNPSVSTAESPVNIIMGNPAKLITRFNKSSDTNFNLCGTDGKIIYRAKIGTKHSAPTMSSCGEFNNFATIGFQPGHNLIVIDEYRVLHRIFTDYGKKQAILDDISYLIRNKPHQTQISLVISKEVVKIINELGIDFDAVFKPHFENIFIVGISTFYEEINVLINGQIINFDNSGMSQIFSIGETNNVIAYSVSNSYTPSSFEISNRRFQISTVSPKLVTEFVLIIKELEPVVFTNLLLGSNNTSITSVDIEEIPYRPDEFLNVELLDKITIMALDHEELNNDTTMSIRNKELYQTYILSNERFGIIGELIKYRLDDSIIKLIQELVINLEHNINSKLEQCANIIKSNRTTYMTNRPYPLMMRTVHNSHEINPLPPYYMTRASSTPYEN